MVITGEKQTRIVLITMGQEIGRANSNESYWNLPGAILEQEGEL